MDKEIKLLALDIDGTIYTTRDGVCQDVKFAIENAKNAGVRVLLCTGRWYRVMHEFCEMLNMPKDQLHVTANGAVTLSTEGIVQDHIGFDLKILHPFLDKLNAKEIGYGLCNDIDFYVNTKGHEPHSDNHGFIRVDDEGHEFKTLPFVSKIYINAKEDAPYVKQLLHEMQFSYASDFEGEFDVWPHSTNKGVALAKLADHYKIPIENVMFMGDGTNDLEALSMVGLGVAMGQAVQRVKDCAKEIAPSYTENGVAWAINKFILKKS
ncbi:MAG: HAD family hydrolase [Spirochaetia bacterium]